MKTKIAKSHIRSLVEEEFNKILTETESTQTSPTMMLVQIQNLMSDLPDSLSEEAAFNVLRNIMEYIEQAMEWMFTNLAPNLEEEQNDDSSIGAKTQI